MLYVWKIKLYGQKLLTEEERVVEIPQELTKDNGEQ